MNKNFRSRVQGVSESALGLLEKGIRGDTKLEGGLMDRCIRLVGQGLSIEKMESIEKQNDRSFGLRLLPFLPKDESRIHYIEETNPEIKAVMAKRPKLIDKK
jgi:hypothetical protein